MSSGSSAPVPDPETNLELEVLRLEVTTLTDLLAVHEETSARQFDRIRAQRQELEQRTASLQDLNLQLTAQAEFLRELYRTLPGVLIVADQQGFVEHTNDAACSLLGYEATELVGRPISGLFDPGDALEAGALGARSRSGQVLRTEMTLVAKTGERIDVFVCAVMGSGEGPASEDAKLVCIALDMRERKRLELELRQAQKLESIGRLAAGVAHEINTPIQFVGDSLHFLRDAATDLVTVLEPMRVVTRSVLDGAPALDAAGAAAEAEEQTDLSYLIEQVPRAVQRALEGLDRVAVIVRSLKEFAHPGSQEMAPADLNRAIEVTLTIARNEYKYVADVQLDLAELPAVRCHIGDLNQAVLNIVVNAAHAIADLVAGTDRRGLIRVRTYRDGAMAVIAIQDSGGGIPEQAAPHIFDPFFTTKEVGKGTGQGLAIARSVVVDRHHGTLTFEAEPGKGTTFYLRIPIDS